MGYWGYLVVGRSERPLAGLDALSGAEDMAEDYFLEPGDAAGRAVAWAAEAGHTANRVELLDVLTATPEPLAENIFFRLLDRLGVVPL
jgi:hypothetical protein